MEEIDSGEPCSRGCSAWDQAHLYLMQSCEKYLPLGSLPKTRDVELHVRVPLSFAPTQYATDVLKVGSCQLSVVPLGARIRD